MTLPCPSCNSAKIAKVERDDVHGAIYDLMGRLQFYREKYSCSACGHSWFIHYTNDHDACYEDPADEEMYDDLESTSPFGKDAGWTDRFD